MNKMLNQQRGMTFLGWCIVLAIIAFFVLLTLRLFPLYNEKFIVLGAMKSVAERPGMSDARESEILKNFLRTVQVGGSTRFDDRSVRELVDIEKPKTKGAPRTMTVTFEARNKFFQDIDFVLNFNQTVELTGHSSGGG